MLVVFTLPALWIILGHSALAADRSIEERKIPLDVPKATSAIKVDAPNAWAIWVNLGQFGESPLKKKLFTEHFF